MNRRAYLGTMCAIATAGCVTTPRSDESTDATESDPINTASTPRRVELGSREGVVNPDQNSPHTVAVRNSSPERQWIAVAIRSVGDGDERLGLDESYELPADAALGVRLLTPSEYRVKVQRAADGARKSTTVTPDWFDCNSSTHEISVPGGGQITVTESSTLLACGKSAAVE